ncbi:MAG TPA: RtcB family protein [Bacteroidales bacterium]|nr:RtcB family protein [Bacteroidales bacterium]
MGNGKIKVKDLKSIHYINDQSRSLAMNIMARHFKNVSKEEKIKVLREIKDNPSAYLEHEYLAPLALSFTERVELRTYEEFELVKSEGLLNIFGNKLIEQGAIRQMELAMQLPVSIQGALMPDAHHGYGLPIGGVLATKNAVIPYGVGLDIGCRMSLVICNAGTDYLKRHEYQLKKALKDYTHFGIEGHLEFSQEHEVLDRAEFQETALLRKLHPKAVKQLGSSGSGNHFVEFGIVEMLDDNAFGIPAGNYLGILAHSGSRGLGASVAQHYTQLAMKRCKLPKQAQHLAWFDLSSEPGQEYWRAMNLAGDYAMACHDRIRTNLTRALGLDVITTIGNHHNFAWSETSGNGDNMIIHRKGATPAAPGEPGIIPGNMMDPGYIVTGKGEKASLCSASHGSGRRLSRSQARETITNSSLRKMLSGRGITLIGGSPEESPLAYKDIDEVMNSQKMLVKTEGKFYPRIVRMNKE